MKESNEKTVLQRILDAAGVQIDGTRPWDIQIRNPGFYGRVLSGASLGLGESYMDGWWDCEALDQFFERVLEARLDEKVKISALLFLWIVLKAKIINLQNRSKATGIGKRHYELGNNLFSAMLDRGLNYSCGYWKRAKTLDDAQEAKLDLICRKMGLTSGMKVLDIGCGWGGFAKHPTDDHRQLKLKLPHSTRNKSSTALSNRYLMHCLDRLILRPNRPTDNGTRAQREKPKKLKNPLSTFTIILQWKTTKHPIPVAKTGFSEKYGLKDKKGKNPLPRPS